MERPDDILFSGAKVGKDTPPADRRRTPRPRANKPPRPTPPPAQTDGQRREEQRGGGTINPYQQRNNLFGTGDTRTARAQRRRERMAARQESRDAFAARQSAEAARAAETPRGRSLRAKPRRPRRNA